MKLSEMQISEPTVSLLEHEYEVLDDLLRLENSVVIELGCGKADKTRLIANKAASVSAFEVDETQLAINKAITDLPNVTFAKAGAEKIPVADSSCDYVFMFKSLHHVPIELMDDVFSEINRVLKVGGCAYISEPVYAGEFNEVLKVFHDEQVVREAAYAAEKRAVSSGKLELIMQKFFLEPMHFESFSQFEERVIGVTHTNHRLSPAQHAEVRVRFNRNMTSEGAAFQMPIRADLFKK